MRDDPPYFYERLKENDVPFLFIILLSGKSLLLGMGEEFVEADVNLVVYTDIAAIHKNNNVKASETIEYSV